MKKKEVVDYKKITIQSNKEIEDAMDVALQVAIMRKEFSLAKTKAKQVEYALGLFVKAIESGSLNLVLLSKVK